MSEDNLDYKYKETARDHNAPDSPQESASDEGRDGAILERDEISEDEEAVSLPLSARRERQGGQPVFKPPQIPEKPEPHYRDIPSGDRLTLRGMSEGAMMVAISMLFALIGTYVPLLSIVGLLLFPLPLAFVVFRRGMATGLVAGAALFGLTAILLGLIAAVMMMLQYGVLGIILGYCFRRGKGALFTLAVTALIAAIGMLTVLMLSLFLAGLPFSALTEQIESVMADYLAMIENQGLEARLIPPDMTAEAFARYATELAVRLFPAFLIIASMLMTALCYLIGANLLRRLGYRINRLPRFSMWRMDWRLSWGLIVGLAAYLLGNYLAIDWLYTLGVNILYVFGTVLFVCGFSFIVWLIKLEGFSPFLKMLLIFGLVFFLDYAVVLAMLFAVLEAVFNLRVKLTDAQERHRGE